MNNLTLVISDTLIHQENNGHYSLNDFHVAAGGESKHQPSNFLRLENTKALIEEIDRSSDLRNAIIVKQGGTNQGTYAVKEIVYAYAMWISPAFSLKVIRAFDALVTGQLIDSSHTNDLISLQSDHISLQRQYIAALKLNNELENRVHELLNRVPGIMRKWQADEDEHLKVALDNGLGPTDIGIELGRSRDSVKHRINRLRAKGMLA